MTLCDPMDYMVHGILQARRLEWVVFPFSRGSSQPKDRTLLPHCGQILYQLSHKGSPVQLWRMRCIYPAAAAAAKSRQSCPTLCDPIDSSPPGSSVHEILQARILEQVAIFLLQRIFSTQGSNPHLLCLLHCRWILHWLSH